jgi:hypothetical protein
MKQNAAMRYTYVRFYMFGRSDVEENIEAITESWEDSGGRDAATRKFLSWENLRQVTVQATDAILRDNRRMFMQHDFLDRVELANQFGPLLRECGGDTERAYAQYMSGVVDGVCDVLEDVILEDAEGILDDDMHGDDMEQNPADDEEGDEDEEEEEEEEGDEAGKMNPFS